MSYAASSSCGSVIMSKSPFSAGKERRWASVTKAWILKTSPCSCLQTTVIELEIASDLHHFPLNSKTAMQCTKVWTDPIPFSTSHASVHQRRNECD